jgi:hypothetical protein
VTEPAPNPTLAELDRMIFEASQAFTKALLARPRDQQRIDDARLAVAELRALKTELYPNG